jgi:acetyl-CoA acetyltransferase
MREVAVVGVGMHPFGKFNEKTVPQLMFEAGNEALQDAGMEWRDIQTMTAGSSRFSGGLGWGLAANEILQAVSMNGIPVFNLSAGCATGASALSVAYHMVADGACDVAMAISGEKMPKGFIPRPPGAADDISDVEYVRWKAIGLANTAYWAMDARRRMHEFGTTEAHFAKVSVKAHQIGALNPKSRYRKAFTLEEVLSSAMVSHPLRVYEICAVSDGAAAVILASPEKWRKRTTKPVLVAATAMATGKFGDPELMTPAVSATAKPIVPYGSKAVMAVRKAYEMAGIGPEDVDLAEIQDNCVEHELALPELFGLCKPGESDWLVDHDETGVNGKMPINTSGGFLSFGEATTVMGLWQVCELTWQLRGQSGPRQVPNAKVGLAATMGLGATGAAMILKI